MARDMLETDADLRKRVEQRFNKRKEFAIHAVLYGFINGGLWLLYILGENSDAWPLTVSGMWGIGLLVHAADTWLNHSRKQLAGEMEQGMKRKRDTGRLQRTVDGDTLEIIEEPDVSKAKRR